MQKFAIALVAATAMGLELETEITSDPVINIDVIVDVEGCDGGDGGKP